MKLLLKILLGLVGVVVLLALAAPFYVDRVAHAAVERGGTRALGVETTVGSVDVALFSGGLSLAGLQVANPEGFPSERFLELERGSAQIELGTLLGKTVRVPSLRLTGGRVNLEREGTRANYAVILDNLGGEEERPTEGEGKGYVIGELLLQDVEVHVNLLAAAGEMARTTVSIEEIRLEDVGSEPEGGVVLRQVAAVLVQAILEAVAEEGVDVLPQAVLQELRAGLDELAPLAERGIGLSSELGEIVEQQAGEKAREVLEGVLGEDGGEDG